MWRLTDSCLWFDEIFSVHAAEHSWSGLWWFVAQDLVHPPLFYAVLKLWIGIGGESLLCLRLLPVFFATLALFPFLHLCRELKIGRIATAIALFLLAVNGSLIKYSQTMRMYTLLMFLALMSVWLFARYVNRGKSWIWLIVVNILLVYTHYYGWLIVCAELVAILIFQRIKIGRMLWMLGAVALSFVPWLIAVVNASGQGSDISQNISWQSRPGLREVAEFFLDLAEPFYFQAGSNEASSVLWIAVPCLALLVIAVAVFYLRQNGPETKLLVTFVAFPLLTAFFLSWLLPHSLWGGRHLIIVTPILLIIGAIAIASLFEKKIGYVVIGLLGALTIAAFVLELRREPAKYVWCAWEGVATEIAAENETMPIYALENLAAYHLWFALRARESERVSVIKGVDARTDDEAYFLPRGFDAVKTIDIDGVPDTEFWLAFRTFRFSEEMSVFEKFTSRGYLVCDTKQERFGTNTVFRVRFARGQTCED